MKLLISLAMLLSIPTIAHAHSYNCQIGGKWAKIWPNPKIDFTKPLQIPQESGEPIRLGENGIYVFFANETSGQLVLFVSKKEWVKEVSKSPGHEIPSLTSAWGCYNVDLKDGVTGALIECSKDYSEQIWACGK